MDYFNYSFMTDLLSHMKDISDSLQVICAFFCFLLIVSGFVILDKVAGFGIFTEKKAKKDKQKREGEKGEK